MHPYSRCKAAATKPSRRCDQVKRLLFATLVAGAIVAASARRVLSVRVVGNSMSPTLIDGERRFAVRQSIRRVRVNDVVVFANPVAGRLPKVLVKRVVAVAGSRCPFTDRIISAGLVVVAGDAPESIDSRHFGPIRESDILGAVIVGRRSDWSRDSC